MAGKPSARKLPLTNSGNRFSIDGGEEAAGAGGSLKRRSPSLQARASGNEFNYQEENVMSNNSTAVSNVIPFDFRGHSVRAVTIAGEPWFVASDVCRVLEVVNTTQAMQALDDDERSMFNIGRQGEANIVNESGLYTLILRSRDAVKQGSKPHAFRKWVTAEVLPAIRNHGRYEDSKGVMTPMVDSLLGKTGAMRLSNVMRCRVAKLDAEHQRSATAKLASAVHACFGVPRIELIPSAQFDAVANFVASYAIEGEYIPRQSSVIPEKLGECERYLISADPNGNKQITSVPMDAFVLSRQQFMKSMLVDGDMPVSTAEMFEFVALATENLRVRSLNQARRAAA